MRTLLTGGNGLLARSIESAWYAQPAAGELITVTREDADLSDAAATARLFERVAPDTIIHAAAKVGGIAANVADPAGHLMDNLQLDSNVLRAATTLGIKNLVYFGSSAMYPRDWRQPLVESDLLAGPLDLPNEGYAIAKIAASKYCEYVSGQFGYNYRVLVLSNLYGPDDHYDLGRAHLVAAAIAKAHAAMVGSLDSIEVWGDGTARREFTYVGDVAEWVVARLADIAAWPPMMNLGFGADHSVREYYEAAMEVVGYSGNLITDPSKPAGMRQRLMSSAVARGLGWAPLISLREGMAMAYTKYLQSLEQRDSTESGPKQMKAERPQ